MGVSTLNQTTWPLDWTTLDFFVFWIFESTEKYANSERTAPHLSSKFIFFVAAAAAACAICLPPCSKVLAQALCLALCLVSSLSSHRRHNSSNSKRRRWDPALPRWHPSEESTSIWIRTNKVATAKQLSSSLWATGSRVARAFVCATKPHNTVIA